MTYDFKLRVGFFKTQKYKLYIGKKQLILIPQEDNGLSKIVVNHSDLISVSIIKGDFRLVELEINAKSGIYTGTFAEKSNIQEIFCVLTKEFGKKIRYE